MAVPTNMRFLSTARINKIIGTLASELEIARPLIYLDRLPLVPAFDDEITGRFTGRVYAADIIADDQEAVVHEAMTLELARHSAPNIKHGQRLGQKMLNRLKQFEDNPSVQGQNALKDWDMKLAENLLLGVRWRMNVLACAMMLDDVNYDRLGIKIEGGTFGMPAELKVTVGTAWSNVNATPLSDIWAVDQVTSLKYGFTFDKITMTHQDFRNMVKTTEFANKATLLLGGYFLMTPAALPTRDDPQMFDLANKVLGKTIELDDFQFNTKNNAGQTTTSRALPTGKVLLSRSSDEGNGDAMDMANGVPTEAIVADMVGGIEGLGGEQFGPLAYWTGRPDLNPPDVVAWGVSKSFPRKHVPEATGVLSVS